MTYTHLSNHHQAERTKYGVQQITNTLTARNKNRDKCRVETVGDNQVLMIIADLHKKAIHTGTSLWLTRKKATNSITGYFFFTQLIDYCYIYIHGMFSCILFVLNAITYTHLILTVHGELD